MKSLWQSLRQLLHRIRSGSIEFGTQPYQGLLERINGLEDRFRECDEDRLRIAADELRRRAQEGSPSRRLLIEAFALAREVASRRLGMRPYDVQVLAGIALDHGRVAEMQTGEGKTLAAVLPAFLQALNGDGVHILTFNDYLARRDAQWMGPVYRSLGLSVGYIQHDMTTRQRQAAYAADVTYVTAKEAGFDFLRDQIAVDQDQLVHRGFQSAIVDEADSIFIDEARVPLVIAGEAGDLQFDVRHLADVVRSLQPDRHYVADGSRRNVNLTAEGLDHLEAIFNTGDLHDSQNVTLLTRMNLALQAELLLQRDIDYLVRDGRVELIDEFTGRVAENRRWPFGLQAAIEAKEGVTIQPDGAILGSITLQHFLEQYARLAGMTGTAAESADELHEFYDLKVVVIPTHEPYIRRDDPDLVFESKQAKLDALVREIEHEHGAGRPVLVGTASVDDSACLAESLHSAGIDCRVLNAKNDELEADIVAEAGALGAITISTNMAGRGTDIRLGGKDERDRESVVALGGLYVIGCNRHESRRIDNQLRGRAGRQGDPGRSRFFVSLEDDLISRYGVGELAGLGDLKGQDGLLADDSRVAHRIAHAQRVIEGETFEIRRTLRRYSAVVERQRREFFARRHAILNDREPLRLLQERATERYRELAERFGLETLRVAERQITLCQMNRCWTDHLAHVVEIRDQIHLFSMGGFNPLDEFHRQINQAFNRVRQHTDDRIIATFHSVDITENGIDLEKEQLSGPSSTWTYMINDTPMGDVLERITRGIKRRLKGAK